MTDRDTRGRERESNVVVVRYRKNTRSKAWHREGKGPRFTVACPYLAHLWSCFTLLKKIIMGTLGTPNRAVLSIMGHLNFADWSGFLIRLFLCNLGRKNIVKIFLESLNYIPNSIRVIVWKRWSYGQSCTAKIHLSFFKRQISFCMWKNKTAQNSSFRFSNLYYQ